MVKKKIEHVIEKKVDWFRFTFVMIFIMSCFYFYMIITISLFLKFGDLAIFPMIIMIILAFLLGMAFASNLDNKFFNIRHEVIEHKIKGDKQ